MKLCNKEINSFRTMVRKHRKRQKKKEKIRENRTPRDVGVKKGRGRKWGELKDGREVGRSTPGSNSCKYRKRSKFRHFLKTQSNTRWTSFILLCGTRNWASCVYNLFKQRKAQKYFLIFKGTVKTSLF